MAPGTDATGKAGAWDAFRRVLDVVFADDQSRLRKGHGARTMAIVRPFAVNLVRTAPNPATPEPSPLNDGQNRRMGQPLPPDRHQ